MDYAPCALDHLIRANVFTDLSLSCVPQYFPGAKVKHRQSTQALTSVKPHMERRGEEKLTQLDSLKHCLLWVYHIDLVQAFPDEVIR